MNISDDFTQKSKLTDLGRYCVTTFVRSVALQLPAGTRLLDAGAGECAYKELFQHCEYRSVDLAIGESSWNYDHLDYISPLDDLPIESDSFDAVLCTQVLEHLQKPAESVKEMFRVLKPGGVLFLTVPMAQSEHQIPYDFFRYTSYGLKYICAESGFREIEIVPMGGMFMRWAYELPSILRLFPKVGIGQNEIRMKGALLYPFRFLLQILIPFVQMFLLAIDRFDRVRDYPWAWQLKALK